MKTVVITGTSRGIGLALAKKFLDERYKVIGTSTSGKDTVKNPNFKVVKLDLNSPSSIARATSKIAKIAPKIDILINNAGVNPQDFDATEMDTSLLRIALETNLIGPIDFTERLLQYIATKGQIINTSSIMGSLAKSSKEELIDDPCYRISKTAINMYTVTLASRLKKKGITVSSLHPGWVKTDMGGMNAPRKPEEAADQIYKLCTTHHTTGLFWYDNKLLAW